MPNKALGRGLDALLSNTAIESATNLDSSVVGQERVIQIAIDKVKTSKYQPRLEFNTEKLNELIGSIKERLITLPDDTKVYPGHGEPTTIGRERRSNPFLR